MSNSFDMTKLRAALQRSRGFVNKSKRELLTVAAKGFVKDIIAITPPGSKGVTGGAAKKAGEGAVAADVARIFTPTSAQGIAEFRALNGEESASAFAHKGAKPIGQVRARILSFAEMVDWHRQRRRKDGRVKQVNRDVTTGLKKSDLLGLDTGIVAFADYQRFTKVLQKNVGILASGWNAAAIKLKVSVPAWVKRHGDGGGSIEIVEARGSFRLVLSNEVQFVGNVKDYERRIQKAIDYQARKLDRQIDHLVKKAIRAGGFR